MRQHNTWKSICLGFNDIDAFPKIPDAEQLALMDSRFGYDDHLRTNGHFKGGEGLQPVQTAMTLRQANG